MRAAAFVVAAAFAACSGDAPTGCSGALPEFTVRGRWDDPTHLHYRAVGDGGPIDQATFARAVQRAVAVWNATGAVALLQAPDGAEAEVTLCWRRGQHGACEPFGPSGVVAHSGPLGRATFVHFDADRQWSEDGAHGVSVFHTALHELGHVLGLGHSACADAVMANGNVVPDRLGAPDLDGLHSLYGGGGGARPGDLRVVQSDGQIAAILRHVAPPGSGHAVFDTDGDGRAELLVWRTDRAAHGALMVYGFAAGPKLARTAGPFLGVTVPGATVRLGIGAAGGRWLLCTLPNGRVAAHRFDDHGTLVACDAAPADVVERAVASLTGDLDGDGRVETIDAPAAPARHGD